MSAAPRDSILPVDTFFVLNSDLMCYSGCQSSNIKISRTRWFDSKVRKRMPISSSCSLQQTFYKPCATMKKVGDDIWFASGAPTNQVFFLSRAEVRT